MRTWLLLPFLLGCEGDPHETDGTDSDPADSDAVSSIVPEEYRYLWNTEGLCATGFGDGNQMYMLFEGNLSADGKFSGTERVWWFYKDKGPEADCVDTFEITGTLREGDPAAIGCPGCEIFYDVRRTITDDTCKERYDSIYRKDGEGLYQVLMLDTLNEVNDKPNEGNRVGVFHEEKQWGQPDYVTKLYAAEPGSEIIPETEVFGPPAGLKWHGKRCQLKFGGGGG